MNASTNQINRIIQEIENNITDPYKLQKLCNELETSITEINESHQYHYNVFLVQLYATKLNKLKKAQTLSKDMIKNEKTNIKIEGYLRLCFIQSILKQYKKANQSLQKALNLTHNHQYKFKQIIFNFLKRIRQSSKDAKILNALKESNDNKFDKALQLFEEEFNANQNQENQYFCAFSIKRLCDLFPQKVKKINFVNYIHFLDEVKEGQEIFDIQDYKERKDFLEKILMVLEECQNQIVQEDFCSKKILSIFKLKKALTILKRQGTKTEVQETKNIIKSLKQNSFSNFNMINDFVQSDFQICQKADLIIQSKKTQLNYFFFRNLTHQLYLKRPAAFSFSDFDLPMQSPAIVLKKNKSKKISQTEKEQPQHLKQQQINFNGSYLIKINANSNGHEKRYFYFTKSHLNSQTLKLYYTNKESKKNNDDDYYKIKNIKEILLGKKTKAFKRSQCKEFQDKLCFSIEMEDQCRDFCAEKSKDFENWIKVFHLLLKNQNNKSNDKKSKSNSQIISKKQQTVKNSNMVFSKMINLF